MSDNTTHLLDIMRRLRNPAEGCPWDIEQDFKSISPYTIEEAYEVADAISRGNISDLKNELGDLLFQVVFHSQIASERDYFTYEDVVIAISEKMVRRHPHVFAETAIGSVDEQTNAWEDFKAQERASDGDTSALANVPIALPALSRAKKLQKRAARVGFDWDRPEHVLDKIREEILEIEAEVENGRVGGNEKISEEIGDLLFTCANLARKWKVDPETALRDGNDKFERRFRAMEAYFENQGKKISDLDLAEMEFAWNCVKKAEQSIDG